MTNLGLSAFASTTFAVSLVLALLLDQIFADPPGFPHPVVLEGRLIALLDRHFNRPLLNDRQRFARGLLLAILLPTILTLLLQGLLNLLFGLNPWIYMAFRVFLLYQLLALRGLVLGADAVARAMREEGLVAARQALSRIVGRDTANLTDQEVVKATVETVAENFSDGVLAPLFFFLLFDLPGIFFYKMVNTLDSMIGYRNARYEYFGKTAARLDDVLNFIPSRLAGLVLCLAAFLTGTNGGEAWRIFRRDRAAHASPNSGQTEAAMAGALGLQLGGSHAYQGKMVEKPTIGDAKKVADISDIDRAIRLLYVAAILSLLFFLLLHWGLVSLVRIF